MVLPSGEIYQQPLYIQTLVVHFRRSMELFQDRRSTRPTAFAKRWEKVEVACDGRSLTTSNAVDCTEGGVQSGED